MTEIVHPATRNPVSQNNVAIRDQSNTTGTGSNTVGRFGPDMSVRPVHYSEVAGRGRKVPSGAGLRGLLSGLVPTIEMFPPPTWYIETQWYDVYLEGVGI